MHEETNHHETIGTRPNTYTFDEVRSSLPEHQQALNAVMMSHTKTEHQLYDSMFAETRSQKREAAAFSIRRLMMLTNQHCYSTVRRARAGLIEKLSIERCEISNGQQPATIVYQIFSPLEIVARREAARVNVDSRSGEASKASPEACVPQSAIERFAEKYRLSRREAEVAVHCADGLTNAEIGKKLLIQEETVKFHLRNVFVKCAVKRRTELTNLLFRQELSAPRFNSNQAINTN